MWTGICRTSSLHSDTLSGAEREWTWPRELRNVSLPRPAPVPWRTARRHIGTLRACLPSLGLLSLFARHGQLRVCRTRDFGDAVGPEAAPVVFAGHHEGGL